MHIWVDLDEVLANTVEQILKHHNYKIWSRKILLEDINDYCIWNIPGADITKEESIYFFKDFFEKWDVCSVKPVNWAKEKLEFLRTKWFETTVITARREELREYTLKWLDKHYKWIFQDVYFADHFTDNHKNKSDICKDCKIHYMIEDSFENSLDTANAGIKTFLLERPWNRHITYKHPNIIRVKDWKEIII